MLGWLISAMSSYSCRKRSNAPTLSANVGHLLQYLQDDLDARRLPLREVDARMRRGGQFLDKAITADQGVDTGPRIAHEQRPGRCDATPRLQDIAEANGQHVVANVAARKEELGAGPQRPGLVVRVAKEHDGRKIRRLAEALCRLDGVALAVAVPHQDHVIAGAGELVG